MPTVALNPIVNSFNISRNVSATYSFNTPMNDQDVDRGGHNEICVVGWLMVANSIFYM